jgi:HEAT repeat protein
VYAAPSNRPAGLVEMRLPLACSILISALAAGQTVSRPKMVPMTTAELDHMFRSKDPRVIDFSKDAGPPLVPHLEAYLRDPDYAIRLLAVDSIAAAGGPEAPKLLIRALGDSNEQVRDNAVNALHDHLPAGQEGALIAAWDSNRARDGYVRQQIPMVLGRMQARDKAADLKGRLGADPRQQVKDGLIAGMSKMADSEARQTFGEMLRDARGKRTAELIELVKYEDEPWVIPLLVPVLQRREIAVRISSHVKTIERRECDLAADQVIRISKAQFNFDLRPGGQYSDAQINEVLRYAQAQAH